MRERTKRKYKRYYKNLKEVKKYIFLRILTVFCISFIFSAGYTLLGTRGIRKPEIFLVLVLGFLVLDVVLMRKVYYSLAHLRKYIMVEVISHGIYALASCIVAHVLSHNYIYELVFGVTDIFEFAVYNISAFVSAVIFNVILFILIRVVPLSMKWVYTSHG